MLCVQFCVFMSQLRLVSWTFQGVPGMTMISEAIGQPQHLPTCRVRVCSWSNVRELTRCKMCDTFPLVCYGVVTFNFLLVLSVHIVHIVYCTLYILYIVHMDCILL